MPLGPNQFYTGRSFTVELGVTFTAAFTTATIQDILPSFYGNPNPPPVTASDCNINIGQNLVQGAGDGYWMQTMMLLETCNWDGGRLKYGMDIHSYNWSSSNLLEAHPTYPNDFNYISQVDVDFSPYATFEMLPAPRNTEYRYVGDPTTAGASVSFHYFYRINGVELNVSEASVTASGPHASASQGACSVSGERGNRHEATFNPHLGNPSSQYLNYEIDYRTTSTYINGDIVPASEYLAGFPQNGLADVLFADLGTTLDVAGSLLPAEITTGTTFKGGSQYVSAQVQDNSGIIDSRTSPLVRNPAGGRDATYGADFVAAVPVNPGFAMYSALQHISSGYTVSIASTDGRTIGGSWSGTGAAQKFTASSAFVRCGYRWLVVSVASVSGASVTLNGRARVIAVGTTEAFVVDRFSDAACRMPPPAFLGQPSLSLVVLSGDATPMGVVGRHSIAGQSGPSGCSIYYSNTNSYISSNPSHYTLGMFCVFSGGCPGLRLDDMSFAKLDSFFTANQGTGVDFVINGPRSPAVNTREGVFHSRSLGLSALNRGLPFFANLDAGGISKPLCPGMSNVTLALPFGDQIGGGDMGESTPVEFLSVCPTAFFYTVLDGTKPSYNLSIQNVSDSVSNHECTMRPNTFDYLLPGSQTPFVKRLLPTKTQKNVIAVGDLQQLPSGHSGGYHEPGS